MPGSRGGGGSKGPQGGAPLDISIELSEDSFRQVMSMVRQAEPALKRELNATLRKSGEVAAAAARAEVSGALPSKADNRSAMHKILRTPNAVGPGRGSSGSLRAAIARGVKVSVRGGKKSAGVRITSSDRALPANKKAMNRVYRLQSFRHPVFGGPGWAKQHGKDWFYAPIKSKQTEFEQSVQTALKQVAETLGNAKS